MSPADPFNEIRPPHPSSCGQCRARKVRCDRAGDCCGPCSRLSLPCSYGGGAGVDLPQTSPQTADPGEVTQAGIKRRRTRCACVPCRVIKAKCSGEDPCARCRSRGLECVQQQRQPSSARSGQSSRSHKEDGHTITGSSDDTLLTPVNSIPTAGEPAPWTPPLLRHLDETEKGLIQAYFGTTDASKCLFLHGPTTLSEWERGQLDPLLVKSLCAAGLCERNAAFPDSSAREQADTWFKEAKMGILGSLNSLSLPRLQALVLIIYHHFEIGDTIEAWNLLAIAARIAFTLKLNHERPGMDPVAQECRRRLAWQIYIMDRNFSGGLEDLEVFPVKRMLQLRLPCDDRTFERGMPSRAQFLVPTEADIAGQEYMDIYSHILRIYASRDRVLRYTKRVCGEGVSPMLSKDELTALEAELNAFSKSLPADIQLTEQRLPLMARSRDSSGYLRLHTVWFQCYCDLYRFLVPGLRESVSAEAMQNTPMEYVTYCQHSVLTIIFQLCRMWTASFKHKPQGSVHDIYLGVSAYQVSQIVGNLKHLLGPNNAFGKVEDIVTALKQSLSMLDPSLRRDFPRLNDCVREVEKAIEFLERGDLAAPSPTSTRDRGRDTYHLISRGSVIPRESSDSDEEQRGVLLDHQQAELPSIPASGSTQAVELTTESGNGREQPTMIAGSAFDHFGLEYEGLQEGMMPWDSFVARGPEDYDPVLGMLGLYTRL